MWFLRGHGWRLETWQDFGATVLAAVITITLCKLSWRFFEKPIVRWSHRWQY
jgi:peptidoglycan/LPS O-acetylase OafA/YrhL